MAKGASQVDEEIVAAVAADRDLGVPAGTRG
jgi:hypothetical protein